MEIDGAEIHEHAWLPPAEVLRRRGAGEVTLAPPTFVTLTLLAGTPPSPDCSPRCAPPRPERFHTQIGRDGGTHRALAR